MSKKVIGINLCDNGSSGGLAISILKQAQKAGYEVILATVDPKTKEIPTFNFNTSKINRQWNRFITKFMGDDGFENIANTKKLIKFLNKEKPDIVHLSTLHGYIVNVEMLLTYLKESGVKVVWTFHDCWPFTGKCVHFIYNDCQKWRTGCHDCQYIHEYPSSLFFDRTEELYNIKKEIFNGFDNLTIVTVSNWMNELIASSIAAKCNHVIIPNGIDMAEMHSIVDSTAKYHDVTGKHLVFAAAYPWAKTKGLDIINKVAEKMGDNYHFVVAGVEEKNSTGRGIERFGRISKAEVISWMKKASVFFNPSLQETFGMTTIESQAVGTPVIVIKNSGASEELIVEGKTGYAVDRNDIDAMVSAIKQCCDETDKMSSDCIENASRFDSTKTFSLFVDLFESITR